MESYGTHIGEPTTVDANTVFSLSVTVRRGGVREFLWGVTNTRPWGTVPVCASQIDFVLYIYIYGFFTDSNGCDTPPSIPTPKDAHR
jgi:hypothetical protein